MALPRRTDTAGVLDFLSAARKAGRPIVPLIGGGVSAESGLPTTVGLARYLAACHLFVRAQVYLPPRSGVEPPFLTELRGRYDIRDRAGRPAGDLTGLADFLADQNWPDPHELTAQLWRWRPAGRPKKEVSPDALDGLLDEELDLLARRLYPNRVRALDDELAGELTAPPGAVWRATGDWKDLVRHLAGFDRDTAEQLFARLYRFARPALGHRMVAKMVRLFGTRLVLTVNIDSLMEMALTAESVPHRRFVLEEGLLYPSERQLRHSVGVVKLHGGSDRLLLDERLDQPADGETLARFRAAFPGDGVLLAVGCGGQDWRVIDLIRRGVLDGGSRAVVWLHHEDTPPLWVQKVLAAGDPQRVMTAGVASAGLFLRHLHDTLTGRHAVSPTAYPVQSEGPALLDIDHHMPLVFRGPDGTDAADVIVRRTAGGSARLFDNRRRKRDSTAPTASERLAQWMNRECSRDRRTPVWIDLEGQYTLAGVVGSIIDQCRVHDPTLAPSVLPPDDGRESETAIRRAAERVAEAVSRGRYFVALDGLEMFAWPPTYHHGQQSGSGGHGQEGAGRLIDFLVRLLAHHPLGGSRLGLAVNPIRTRWGSEPASAEERQKAAEKVDEFDKLLDRLTDLLPDAERIPHFGESAAVETCHATGAFRKVLAPVPVAAVGPGGDEPAVLRAQLALFLVCSFRRTRTLVGLKALLDPLLRGPAEGGFDHFLNELTAPKCRYLLPVEGGLYWMNRELRNGIYETNSEFTSNLSVGRALDGTVPAGCLLQLVLLGLGHNAIARYYYFDTFIPSRDPQAFFEYVYHRVSSIRYLTKAVLVLNWLRLYPERLDQPADVRDGLTRLAAALRSPNGRDPQHHLDSDELFSKPAMDKLGVADLGNGPAAVGRFVTALLAVLHGRRTNHIQSFRLAWSLADRVIQAQVPAEQMISWCSWLVDEDLPRFTVAWWWRRCRADAGLPPADLDPNISTKGDDEVIRHQIADLGRELYQLQAGCMFERTDYRGCVARSLHHLANDPAAESLRGSLDPALAAGPVGGASPPAAWLTTEQLNALTAWLETVMLLDGGRETRAAGTERAGAADARDEGGWRVVLRCLIHLANCHLSDAAPPPGRPAAFRLLDVLRPRTDRRQRVDTAVGMADFLLRQPPATWPTFGPHDPGGIAREALTHIRGENRRDHSAGPHTPYFLHRSQLLRRAADAEWANVDQGGEEVFRAAYQKYELARGSLDATSDRITLANIEMSAARCAIAHASWFVRAATPTDLSPLRQARAKLDMAADYLRVAVGQLHRARRNVVWWDRYYRIRAVYKAARNAERLAHRPAAGRTTPSDPVIIRLTTTLRHALGAIRYLRMLELPAPDGGTTPAAEWTRRLVVRLRTAAFLILQRCEEKALEDGGPHLSWVNLLFDSFELDTRGDRNEVTASIAFATATPWELWQQLVPSV